MTRRKMISEQFIRFDTEGITYTGELTSKEKQMFRGKEVGRYTIKNESGSMAFNGTDQLDKALANAEVGQIIEILYLGEEKTSEGFDVKRFEVYVLEEEDDDGKE